MPLPTASARAAVLLPVSVALLVLLAGVGAGMGGCATKPAAEVGYLEAYEQKQFADAFAKASQRAQDPKAPDRERAQLVAGMSAQALGRRQDAKNLLTPLRGSTDNIVSGRAQTTLGLMAAQAGDDRTASALLRSGARKLDGQDAALANLHAGAAMERIGLRDEASKQYASGVAEAGDPTLKAMLTERSKPLAYFVQFGAFTTRAAADAKAQKLIRTSARKGDPALIVIETPTGGRTLFAVQVGPYSSVNAARLARTRFAQPGSAVTRRRAS